MTKRKKPEADSPPPVLGDSAIPTPPAATPPPAKRPAHRPPRFKVAVVEQALREGGGIYTVAARMLGCAPNTIHNYVAKHKKLQTVCREVEQITLDLAEGKLMQAINASNLTAIIFYLKTKGKHRGYSERQEITGAGGAPLVLSAAQAALMTDEQLDGVATSTESTLAAFTAGGGAGGDREKATPSD